MVLSQKEKAYCFRKVEAFNNSPLFTSITAYLA